MSCWSKIVILFTLTAAVVWPDSKVFVLQETNQPSQISIFSGNPLALQKTITSVPRATLVLENPLRPRIYVLGKSGQISVLDSSANYAEVDAYNATGNIQVQQAVITPDGQKMVILASDGIRIINIGAGAPDRPVSTAPFSIQKASQPHDVAVSFDSKIAYVTSQVSRTVTAVDLNTRKAIAQEELAESPSGVTVSPNGLVYVSSPNTLYEFEGKNGLQMTVMGGFPFIGNAGKPLASPDGKKILMLSTTAEEVFCFDVLKRAVQVVNAPSQLSHLTIASNTIAYARGKDGVAYQMYINPIDVPSKANIGFPTDLVALTLSDELTEGRFVYGQTSNRIIRYDRVSASTTLVEAGTISPAGSVIYLDQPSSNAVSRLVATAVSFTVTPGSQSLPLAVRALDGNGRPVPNAEITFSSNAQGLQLQETKVRTNNQGLAATWANVPSLVGRYIVRATGPNGSVELPINVEARVIRQTEFSILRGNGQISVGGQALSQHMTVRLTDSSGRPVPGVTVNWKLKTGGPQVALTTALPSDPTTGTSTTDAEGISMGGIVTTPFQKHIFQYVPYTIDATIRYEDVDRTVQFNGIVYPDNSVSPYINLKSNLTPTNGEYVFPAGAVVTNAFRAEARTADSSPLPVPLPNVGIRAFTPGSTDSQVRCQGNPVSKANGIVECTLVLGTTLGASTMQVVVGELPAPAYNFTYPIRITAGPPGLINIVRGDGQSGLPGEKAPLALVAIVADAGGNILTGVPVSWTISSGDGELVNARNITDHTGQTSTEYRFGQRPGPVSIVVTAGSATRTFTLTNNAPTGTVSIVEGNDQRARLDTEFKTPLTVKVIRNGNLPLPGVKVDFAVKSGSVVLKEESAITNEDGIARVVVKAGTTAGAAVVTATLVDSTVDFNLTVNDINPQIESILNGASFVVGDSIAACSIAVIRGTGFTTDLEGILSSTPDENGSLPYTLSDVSVTVNDVKAPIFYLSNIEGVEQIGIQVPCELKPGTATVKVTTQEVSASKESRLASAAPGIFETYFIPNQRQGVVVKAADKSYVSPENPAVAGETLIGYFTGLTPTGNQTTNKVGEGQSIDISKVVIGLNFSGMPVLSAKYVEGSLGVYVVEFLVTADAGAGSAQNYSVGVADQDGKMVYSNSSFLPVRSN